MSGQHRTRLASLTKALLGCTILSSAMATPADAGSRPVITALEPVEFANITAERTMLVDLYYGGTRRGETRVSVTPGEVRFDAPDDVLSLLPALEDPDRVLHSISGQPLPSNSGLKCTPGADPRTCGRMSPALLSVIYDPDKFRVDIFLNPELVRVQSSIEDRFLAQPQGGLSLVNSVAAAVSGQFGVQGQHFSVFDQLVLADGEQRFRAELGYADGIGLQVDRLALEWDRPGVRLSAGALWSPGTEIDGRRKLFGAGLESQIDTRVDKDSITGSPIVFYLNQRARVDVLRDGRLLSSAVYEAGNRQIDASNLPDGSYDIILRIEEPGQLVREERRFFTKSRQIPSLGRTDYILFGGVLTGERGWARKQPDGAYVHGGLAFRASRKWVFGGSLELADGALSTEISATLLTSVAQVRATTIADSDGNIGGILQIASSGTSRLNFNFDLRQISRESHHLAPVRLLGAFGGPGVLSNDGEFYTASGDYSQLGGLVSYNLANLRFLGTGFYRDDAGKQAQYSIGPAVEMDVFRRGQLTLTVRGDMAITERGNSGFAGISLRMFGSRAGLSVLAGGRASSVDDDDRGEGAVASIAGSWTGRLAGGDLALGAGIEHQPNRDNAVLTGDFRHHAGSLSADLVHANGSGRDPTHYSLGLQTTFAAGAGEMRIAGKTASESLVVARVSGDTANDTFEVLINEQPAGSLVGGNALTLALPGYRSYQVRIRPTGERVFTYDSAPRVVTLYPGSVVKLEWQAAPITMKVGRLIAADGEPVRRAVLTARGAWGETSDEGRFQIEAPDDAELLVSLSDGTSFITRLPAGLANSGVFEVGSIICCKADAVFTYATPLQVQPREE